MRLLFFVCALLLGSSVFASDSLYITTSDSTKIFVRIAGKGKPVLFIHGGPGSTAYYFEQEGGTVFEKDVQMIYMDQRGCGRSSFASNGDYSLDRVVKDFDEVRKALGYSSWTIMPHSFGGILATNYALQYPGTINKMVFLNCTVDINHSAKSGIEKTIEILDLKGSDKDYLLSDTVSLLQRWGNAFWHLRNRDMVYKVMFDKKESYKLDSTLMNQPFLKYEFNQRIWGYPEYFRSYAEQTSIINIPVLVISGTRDYTIGTEHPSIMKFPDMRVRYVEGGHALYLENNKEMYKAISPFLKRI
jgi:proline iminopeptidase